MIKRDTTCFSSDLDMGRRPELKSDEKRDVSLSFIEILDCEHFFTAEKVLQFIGASVRGIQARVDSLLLELDFGLHLGLHIAIKQKVEKWDSDSDSNSSDE